MNSLKITKQRLAWIVPNVFCYLMFAGGTIFIALNVEGLEAINRLDIWVLAMIFLFVITILGSYSIVKWMKEGRL